MVGEEGEEEGEEPPKYLANVVSSIDTSIKSPTLILGNPDHPDSLKNYTSLNYESECEVK